MGLESNLLFHRPEFYPVGTDKFVTFVGILKCTETFQYIYLFLQKRCFTLSLDQMIGGCQPPVIPSPNANFIVSNGSHVSQLPCFPHSQMQLPLSVFAVDLGCFNWSAVTYVAKDRKEDGSRYPVNTVLWGPESCFLRTQFSGVTRCLALGATAGRARGRS